MSGKSRSEGEFKALAENVPDIIARLDRHQRYLYVNPVFEKTMGLPAYAVLGKRNRDLDVPEALHALGEQKITEVLETGRPKAILPFARQLLPSSRASVAVFDREVGEARLLAVLTERESLLTGVGLVRGRAGRGQNLHRRRSILLGVSRPSDAGFARRRGAQSGQRAPHRLRRQEATMLR